MIVQDRSMPRIPLPSADEMTLDQRAVYDEVVSGPRGRLVGPLRAVIHSPDLASRWSKLGEFLRYNTCLPRALSELAILVTGRRWNSQVEFHIHRLEGLAAGLDPAVIEAIRLGRAPIFTDVAAAEIYEFSRQLQQTGTVAEVDYAAVRSRWGERGVVELTALVGYYTMVSMTLNVHGIPLPDDSEPPLAGTSGDDLTELPRAAPSASGV
jgi:4-carboxymuconolactone decarboxylase